LDGCCDIFSKPVLPSDARPSLLVFVPELSPIFAESWPLVSCSITISLFDSGVSFTGVGEEWMRPSESAIASANVSFDWVVIAFAFFLFDLTPPACNKRAWAKVPKEGCNEKGRFEPGPHRVGGWQGRTPTRRLLLSTSSLHSGYALNREGVLYA